MGRYFTLPVLGNTIVRILTGSLGMLLGKLVLLFLSKIEQLLNLSHVNSVTEEPFTNN